MRKYMSKRQRPCDSCRLRKTACRIDLAPPCRACALSHRDCTFIHDAPQRKRLDSHSLTTGSTSHNLVNSSLQQEDAVPGYIPDGLFTNPLGQDDDAVGQMMYGMSFEMLDRLDIDMNVGDYPTLSPFSPSDTQQNQPSPTTNGFATPSLDGDESKCPQVIGLSSDMDPFLLQQYNTDSSGFFHFKQLSIHSVQSQPYPVQFLKSTSTLFDQSRDNAGNSQVPDAQLRGELESLVPAHTGTRLIALFREFIYPQYPILAAEAVPEPATSPVHLLAAIYAVSFPFSMYDEQLCIDLAYDTPPHAKLSRLINISLGAALHAPTIPVAQTLIILVIQPLSNPLVLDSQYKWSLMGSLTSTAVTLGLHLDPGAWMISPWQIALRRRLSFIIWALDKWLSASLGRPRQLTDEDWLVTALDQSDRTHMAVDEVIWNNLVDLSNITTILDSALSCLFSLRASQQIAGDPQHAESVAHMLLQKLATIPSRTGEMISHLSTVQLLAYHYIRLLLVRTLVRCKRAILNLENADGEVGASPNQNGIEMEQYAREFIGYIKTIKVESTQIFWPPWCPVAFSTLCFAILSAFTMSATENEATSWLELLQTTRRELRMKAITLPVLRLGLLRIDAIFWRGLDNVLHLEPHVRIAMQRVLRK